VRAPRQEAGNEWVRLDDGRWLCLACVGTVVMDSRDAAPLYRNVLAFYTRMGMPFPETVPLHVVDGSSMRECLREEGNNHVPHTGVGEMRGLCISHEHVIRTVSRTPGRGGLAVGFHERVIKETVSQSVSAILVLYGLPALLTGTIIAHECMHAFLRFSRCRKLTPAVEEGLCQLMALLWLKGEDVQREEPHRMCPHIIIALTLFPLPVLSQRRCRTTPRHRTTPSRAATLRTPSRRTRRPCMAQ
jgi:hypothetical protein